MAEPIPDSALPRVLHIASERGWRGGEQQVYLLVRGLAALGVKQALLTPHLSELAVRCRAEGLCDILPLAGRGRYRPGNWQALRRAVAAFRPDLLHAHTAHAHALAWLAGPRTLPIVATRRVDFALRRGLSFGRRYRSRRVFSVAISRAIEALLLDFGCPRERVFLVPSGIDAARFASVASPEERAVAGAAVRGELALDADTLLLGNTAALADHKGQRYLLEALGLLRARAEAGQLFVANKQRRLVCAIAGRGELHDALAEQIRRERLDRPDAAVSARLLGFRQDVPRLLAAFDIFVVPSVLEGLGTAAIDATCMGLPIVSTEAGGLGEILRDEETALLVPPRDAAALAAAIERLADDDELRARLGAAARESFEGGPFTADAMVAGNLEVYRQVLAAWAAKSSG